MPETYDQYLQRRGTLLPKPEQEHGLGSSFVSGLTLGYAGENPQTISELLSYGAGSVLPYVAAEFGSEGLATPLLGAKALAALKAFKAANPILSSMAKQGAIFGTLGALQKPQEGESRLLEGAKGAALGAAYPAVIKPAASILKETLGPLVMPSRFVAQNILPDAARESVTDVIDRLTSGPGATKFRGTRGLGVLQGKWIDKLKALAGDLPEDQRSVLFRSLEQPNEAAMASLPPELAEKFPALRSLMNTAGSRLQWAKRRSIVERGMAKLKPEDFSSTGEFDDAVRGLIRGAREIAPPGPQRAGYYPRGIQNANFAVLRRQPNGEMALTEGSRDLASNLAEAQALKAHYLEQGIPESDIEIFKLGGQGTDPRLAVARNLYFGSVGQIAKELGLKPQEFLAQFGEKLPFRLKAAQWSRGKFFGPLQQRKGILGDPEYTMDELERYLSGAARYSALSPELAYAGRQQEKILPLLGGEQSRYGRWFKGLVQGVAGHPTDFEKTVSDAAMKLAGQGVPYAAHFAGDPTALRRISGTIRAVGSFTKLGLSFAAPAWNLAQTTNLVPKIGARATVNAIWDVLKNGNSYKNVFDAVGVQPMSKEVAKLALGDVRGKLATTAANSLWLFSKSEHFVQQVAAAGAYRSAIERGLSRTQAIVYAKRVLVDTMFDYGKANVPQIMRGPLGQVLFQFKTFTANQLAYMFGLSKKEAAIYFPMMAAIAGTGAIPGKEEIDDLVHLWKGEQPISEIELSHPRLTSGIPGLLGVSTQQSLGVTQGALPLRGRLERYLGPTIGSALEAANRIQQGQPFGRVLRSQAVFSRRGQQAADLLISGAVRSPETGELLYRVPGAKEYAQQKPRTLAEAKKLNIERLRRQLGYTPRLAKGRAYGRYQAAEAEKASSPQEAMLALMMLSGFQPTALRAQLLAGNLTAEDIAQVLKMQRKGETPQEMLDSMRQLR